MGDNCVALNIPVPAEILPLLPYTTIVTFALLNETFKLLESVFFFVHKHAFLARTEWELQSYSLPQTDIYIKKYIYIY